MKNIININVVLNEEDDLYHKYNKETLNPELSKYIYDECLGHNLKKEIIINIKANFDMNKELKNKCVNLIRSTYGLEVREQLIYSKYTNFKTIIFCLIGILFLIINQFLSVNFVAELFLIIGWLSIWDTLEQVWFVDTKQRIKIKRLKKLTKCKIDFIDKEM